MIKLWDFQFNQLQGREAPDATDSNLVQDIFDRNLDRMVKLEGFGFEGVFYSEHHFIDALSPAPNLLIAAISQRTKRMRLGVMGNVLPFHQPWRLAEELGMLDYITHGRLEIGMAPGVPPEFLFVGIPQAEVRPMFAEMLDFLENAFVNKYATHKGKYWNFDGIPTMPRLRPETRRRKWLTIRSAETCQLAARRDFKVCTGFQEAADAAVCFDAYRAEADKLGRKVGPDDIGVRRQCLIWDTDATAQALHKEIMQKAQERVTIKFAPVNERLKAALGEGPSAEVKASGVIDAAAPAHPVSPLARRDPRKPAGPNLLAMKDEFIVGSPKTVAEGIIHQCRVMGAGNFMAYYNMSLEEHEVDHHISHWPEVMAILKKADIGVAA